MTKDNGVAPRSSSLPKKTWIQTPVIHSKSLSRQAGCQVYLKLDNLQPSGSFKSRGIGNYLRSQLLAAGGAENGSTSNGTHNGTHNGTRNGTQKTHFFSSSGGNAGLACVTSAVALDTAATVVVPMSTSAYMIDKIKHAGATEVIQEGKSWAEADAYLRDIVLPAARARGENAVYVHPFDAQATWDGHSTLVDELVQEMPEGFDALVCSVGGGGLLSGIMQGLDAHGLSDVTVIAMETNGADSLSQSVKAGKLVTLPQITSIATTLGARTVAAKAFEYSSRPNVKSVVVEDKEAIKGCMLFAEEHKLLVEVSCGVCIAICSGERLKALIPSFSKESRVVIEVCGGSNISVDLINKWNTEYF